MKYFKIDLDILDYNYCHKKDLGQAVWQSFKYGLLIIVPASITMDRHME
jgi:hypothetical protein